MQILGVADVTRYIKELFLLDPVVGDVWVRGEVSNVSRPASGHIYWTLKDGAAQLKCVMFRREALFQAMLPEAGSEVLAHGRIDVYESAGAYQFYVDLLERQGIGVLYAQFEALKRRLEAEGLFAEERKRPLPERPKRIGLVTSPAGAVLHDVISVLSRRWPHADLIVAPARVQGQEAAAEICRALDCLAQLDGVAVIIIARGGGSIEDLWAFNEEAVARGIAACVVPVISAIGHETDFTIADFVADLRAPTPSAAAELVAPCIEDDRQMLTELTARLANAADAGLEEHRQRLNSLRGRLATRAPLVQIRRERQQLDEIDGGLRYRLQTRLAADRRRLHSVRRQLDLLDPLGTLQRGYAIVRRTSDGAIVTSPAQVAAEDTLDMHVAGGHIPARVTQADE
ncbi:MAG TPA: exodeoxyribonuclease VII large subunit [Chloroflexota bacterium]|nr:exodeoxyribonuclease VII large subunit [Chloroflexota bacterium]